MGAPHQVIISISLIPNDVNANFSAITDGVKKVLNGIAQGGITFKKVPIAFGLESLDITFIMEESHGSEKIEKALSEIPQIQTVEVKAVSLYETKEFKPLIEEPKKEPEKKPAKKASKK